MTDLLQQDIIQTWTCSKHLKRHMTPKRIRAQCAQHLTHVSLNSSGTTHGAHYGEALLQMKWPFIGRRELYDMSPREQKALLHG